jgi:hypothetical protein
VEFVFCAGLLCILGAMVALSWITHFFWHAGGDVRLPRLWQPAVYVS